MSANPPPAKHIILFLAANPIETDRLALDREAQAIQVELERSGHRDCFEFMTRWAVQPLDLLRELRRLRPTVVHFSGHGAGGTARGHARGEAAQRDFADLGVGAEPRPSGLYFQAPDGRAQLVATEALEETFDAVRNCVKLVVLNACFSDFQAKALLAHVDCVVGMRGTIQDSAARSFAIGFYGGLGERESVTAAFRQGRAAISLEGLEDADRPQLGARSGVDPDRLVLAAERQADASPSVAAVPPARRHVAELSPMRKALARPRVALALIAVAVPVAVWVGRAWLANDVRTQALELRSDGWKKLTQLETEDAESLLQRSVGKDPDASLSRAALAIALAEHGNYRKAQDESRAALERGGRLADHDRTWVEGVAAETRWELSKAADVYRRAWMSSLFKDREAGLRLAHVLTLAGDEVGALLTLDRVAPASSDDDVRVDYERAMAARGAGTFQDQIKLLDRIATRNARHPRVVAVAHWRKCFALLKGREPDSMAACEIASQTFAEYGDQLGRARTLAVKAAIVAAGLGNLARTPEHDRLKTATELTTEAYRIASNRQSQIDQAGALQNRANIWRQRVQYEAQEADRQATLDELAAIDLFRAIGHMRAVAELQNNQALMLMDAHKHSAALELFRKARQAFEASGARSEIGVASANIGKIQFLLGELAGAEHSLIQGLQIAAEQGQKDYLVDALIDLGSVYMAQDKLCAAEHCFGGLQCYPPESRRVLTQVGEDARWESSVLTFEGGCSNPRTQTRDPLLANHPALIKAQMPNHDEDLEKAQDHDRLARALLVDAVEDFSRNRVGEGKAKATEARNTARAGALLSASEVRLEISLLLTEARAEGLLRNFEAAQRLLTRARKVANDRELVGDGLEVQLAELHVVQLSGRVEDIRRLAQELHDAAQNKGFLLIKRKVDALLRNDGRSR